MTKRDILSVAFKIMGVLLAASAILFMPIYLMTFVGFAGRERMPLSPYWYWAAAAASPVVTLCVAYLLLRFSDAMAGRLAARDNGVFSVGLAAGWEKAVFGLSLRIAGAGIVARGIPDLIRSALSRRLFQGFVDVGTLLFDVVHPLLTLIIGAYLLTGAKHLVRFLFREPPATAQPGPTP